MARNLEFLVVALLVFASSCESAIFNPVSESHRSAALELFSPADGSFGSLEETYEALKTCEVLGIEKKPDIRISACASVVDTLLSTSTAVKDLFHALRVNGILKCELNDEAFAGIESRLKDSLNNANSLLDFYYSIGGLVLIKDQTSAVDVLLTDADKISRSIKALSQSDGRWRLNSNNPESSNDAAGKALEALAGVISLASSEIDQSLIATLKNDIAKLFDGVARYDDGTCYFDEKLVDARGHQGPLSASASVVRGITAFAEVTTESLNVRVSTVLGSSAPPLTVKLMQTFISGSKDASIIDQIVFDDPEQKKNYATGGRTKVPIHVTGAITIDSAEIAILDSDIGSPETQKKLDLPGENAVALSANHLQKLMLSFRLTTPSGHAFKPHQDFLGLVEKFYYLSGKYDIQLTVGDSVMENSFLQPLGHIELDLPDAPEKAARPPPQPVDPYSRYGPKAEITHIFRAPEKRPPRELSLAFLGLVFLPLFGFLAGLFYLRANLKNLPKSTVPATFAILFHLGIAAVLALYALFWFKLDLFTTLKALGLLGMFLMFVGHKTLSHLASTSAKLKSA
ncbi:hypothetical protein DH2020_001311 [Rehmannia glutinosa]|uniref:Dolichyl-diphosphooligosaccharide--protein glycosyltransferase subunit 2 n=1 Tax=Rehmannia glutinosa TaxID=99300 RepID=A0ABR0XZ19_REHGL